MRADIVIIENDQDLAEAQALVAELGASEDAVDIARLRAQAILLAAYEEKRWPTTPVSAAEIVQYIMDQNGLAPADLSHVLGSRSRVTEVLNGRRPLSLGMIRRMRSTYHVSADALIEDDQPAAMSA